LSKIILKKGNIFEKHQDFNPNTLMNDIAIIKLSVPVRLNRFIQIACLPKTQSTNFPSAGSKAWIVGWVNLKFQKIIEFK
jgi:hypothetical protein